MRVDYCTRTYHLCSDTRIGRGEQIIKKLPTSLGGHTRNKDIPQGFKAVQTHASELHPHKKWPDRLHWPVQFRYNKSNPTWCDGYSDHTSVNSQPIQVYTSDTARMPETDIPHWLFLGSRCYRAWSLQAWARHRQPTWALSRGPMCQILGSRVQPICNWPTCVCKMQYVSQVKDYFLLMKES